MKITIAGRELETPMTFCGRNSDLEWLCDEIMRRVSWRKDEPLWGSEIIAFSVEPGDEREAKRAAEDRRHEDWILEQAETIKMRRANETNGFR